MNNNPKDLAQELAVVTLIADLSKEHRDALRLQLLEALELVGADSTSADVDGDRVAKVTKVTPKAKAVVNNESAFLAWVSQNRPDEVVSSVRESYKKSVLDRAAFTDDGTAIDADTGEVIPGLTQARGNGYVSTRFEKDGRQRLAYALKNGLVAFNLPDTINVPALEAGNS